jgi:hypothetical protein
MWKNKPSSIGSVMLLVSRDFLAASPADVSILEMLKNEFVNAGFMVDERRPLKVYLV